jgi:hypothetical protein
MRDNSILLALPDAGHEQDARPDAGPTQGAALSGIGHSEPRRALSFQCQRAFRSPVAVSVCFHHRADGNLRPDVLLHSAKILAQCRQRNFRPRPPIQSKRSAFGYLGETSARGVHKIDYSERPMPLLCARSNAGTNCPSSTEQMTGTPCAESRKKTASMRGLRKHFSEISRNPTCPLSVATVSAACLRAF